MLVIAGCKAEDIREVPSTDLRQLSTIVNLDLPLTEGKYEIFTTPESSGAIPGPTSYVTLIGEFSTTITSSVNRPTPPDFWILSNSIRPWLSQSFKEFLTKYKNDKISKSEPCFKITGRVSENHKELEGIACLKNNKALVYLPLVSED